MRTLAEHIQESFNQNKNDDKQTIIEENIQDTNEVVDENASVETEKPSSEIDGL